MFQRGSLKIHFQKDVRCGIIKISKRGGQYHDETAGHVRRRGSTEEVI